MLERRAASASGRHNKQEKGVDYVRHRDDREGANEEKVVQMSLAPTFLLDTDSAQQLTPNTE